MRAHRHTLRNPSPALPLLLVLAVAGCEANEPLPSRWPLDDRLSIAIPKWPNGASGAISLTYDSDAPESVANQRVQQLVRKHEIVLDYEFVPTSYRNNPERMQALRDLLESDSFSVFGHGYTHDDHDSLSAQDALDSFRRCHQFMQAKGLPALAYAYPGGHGKEPETQRALAASGFLSGRLFAAVKDALIVPGNLLEPPNWFALPTVQMESLQARDCTACTNSTAELRPRIEDATRRRGWLILTYHAIGEEGGWGYYPLDSFSQDLELIAGSELWNASFGTITEYLHQRAALRLEAGVSESAGQDQPDFFIKLTDGLPDDIFDQAMPLELHASKELQGRRLEVLSGDSVERSLVLQAGPNSLPWLPDEKTYHLRLREP